MVNSSLKDFHSPGWEGAPATERKREQGDGRPAEPPEYQDAGEFFSRTYMTEGLRDLMANGVRRLTGAGGDPVVQLQTNFGGGKTHSMLALYHIFGEDIEAELICPNTTKSSS